LSETIAPCKLRYPRTEEKVKTQEGDHDR